MAVDEESFYTITGEEITRGVLVDEMINLYSLKLEAGDTRVTDFNEGSEIRNLLEAIAVDVYYLMEEQNELSLLAFIDTAEGEYLDKHGANPFINLPRDTGQEAVGYVTFTIPEVSTEDIVIPEETIIVSEDTGLEFATEGEVILTAGDTSIVASAVCLTTGSDGNAEENTITMIDDDYLDVPELTVNNLTAFTGGTDYEEDDEYRERLLAYVRKDDFGSIGYYTELGNNVPGVHDVYLIDDENEVFTKIVLVNVNQGETVANILTDVLAEYTDSENIVIGHTFSVAEPRPVTVPLTVNLTVQETLDENIIQDCLNCLFYGGEGNILIGYDYEGLSIGETLRTINVVSTLELLDGVETVEVLSDGNPLDDISVDRDEIIKLGTIAINQTVST